MLFKGKAIMRQARMVREELEVKQYREKTNILCQSGVIGGSKTVEKMQ